MNLFAPGKIGKVHIKNRIVMAAMGIGGLAEPEGQVGKRAREYYAARARGGVGLIVTAAACVDRVIDASGDSFLGADAPLYVGGWSELADTVHDYGAKVFVQLTAGRGRIAPQGHLKKFGAVAPSPTPCFWDPKVIARELKTEEVEKLVQAFGRSAELLRSAGIDGVELHAHDGYLLDQFLTSLWNQRSDKYGGNLEGRLMFIREILAAMKKSAGEDFPIIYRFGLAHYYPGGRKIPEGLEIVRRLEKAGMDAFHIDAGCYETRYWAVPPATQAPGCMVDLAEKVKGAVAVPVIAVGRLGYPAVAEKVLAKGKADFIALGRALLADPEWPRKVLEKKSDDIIPCISCFQGCLRRIYEKKYISCAVNPATGIEQELGVSPAAKKRSVLVIGGGPAGMEAARVCALRGHRVTLWEKKKALGGNLVPAAVPGFKADFHDLINYYKRQMKKTRVKVELGREATPNSVRRLNPDVVFVATGSTPLMPDIPGIQSAAVASATDILLGKRKAGKNVVVIGGGMVGCETALHLAEAKKKVTVLELLDRVAGDMFVSSQMHIEVLFREKGIAAHTQVRVAEITREGVLVSEAGGRKKLFAADTVVVATGFEPLRKGFETLSGRVPEVHFIGDCAEPRNVMRAIWEGYRTARIV